jgi:dienelactone hydrolase
MITSGEIVLQRDGDREFDAYLARPAGAGPGTRPSIIIFTEMFGMARHNFEMADAYARRGFLALVPNLFWRSPYPGELGYDEPDRSAAFARLAAFDVEAGGRDIVTAVKWLRGQPPNNGKVFALGFCAGGRMAFVVAANPAQAAGFRFTYVSNTGNDINNCDSPATACATFNTALGQTANYGEIDCVNTGPYGQSFTITQSVTINCAGAIGGKMARSS